MGDTVKEYSDFEVELERAICQVNEDIINKSESQKNISRSQEPLAKVYLTNCQIKILMLAMLSGGTDDPVEKELFIMFEKLQKEMQSQKEV